MDIYITLDYELFFGEDTGSVDDCLIQPTKSLLSIVAPLNIKVVFFVDVGYLIKLKEYKNKFAELKEDYNKVVDQLRLLTKNGHSIQLHIHPHWQNSYYNGSSWVFDHSQYKLSDFNKQEARDIILKYFTALFEITGKRPTVFRAGGWSMQPFDHIREALIKCGITTDSTVFAQGYYRSTYQSYNFKGLKPFQPVYNFNSDPNLIDTEGRFKEYPISSIKVSPLFFWKFVLIKLLKKKEHDSYGKGSAIKKSKTGLLKLLFMPSYSVVSMDGYKASLLEKSFKNYLTNSSSKGVFIIIGHPKAFSSYSLKKTKEFVEQHHRSHTFRVF